MGLGTSRYAARRALAGALLLLGCAAGDLVATDAGFQHLRHGYGFASPGPGWERIEVEHAVVAFRRAGAATMSLQSRCAGPLADPATLARHLRIGLPGHRLLGSGPFDLAGREAWSQVFEAPDPAGAVRVKTVTLVQGPCTLDWVLVATRDFGQLEPDFDAWVRSLRLPGRPVPGGGS